MGGRLKSLNGISVRKISFDLCKQKYCIVLFYNSKDVSLIEYNDPTLLRFLRARKFDVEKTEKMFFDFLKWREET